MSYTELLKPGNFYHLYNRGNSGCDLFREDGNYDYFLQLYDKYIPSVADTYAWVLMKNHFHFLVRVKDLPGCNTTSPNLPGFNATSADLAGTPNLGFAGNSGKSNLEGLAGNSGKSNLEGFAGNSGKSILEGLTKNLVGLTKPPKPPYQYFSNLFNAYTKAYNKKYKRTGSLFEKNFHRKSIHNIEYLRNVIVYIHRNPVHHRFCNDPSDYPWSSYKTCFTLQPTKLKRDAVIGWFNDLGNFTHYHQQNIETDVIEKWLEI